MVATAQDIIKPISRFQRAIHVRYDLRDANAVEQYIPTQSAVDALKAILRSTSSDGFQRAHVLHAAYGSGKSHFAVALASLLENARGQSQLLNALAQRTADVDPACGELARRYIEQGKRLFPVVLSGNEGNFAAATLRALARSLNECEIDLQLSTRFEAAINTIERWRTQYPNFYRRLSQELNTIGEHSVSELLKALQAHNDTAYKTFADLHIKMTAGAVFDPLVEQSPELIYRDASVQLRSRGYDGIVVIWDEFGRYLEAHTSQAFSSEAAGLQNFAETCNYSGDAQLHLLLFTHKELQGYAASLPSSYQQEWSRIEGRFQKHNLATDPVIAYRLIASAVEHPDSALVDSCLQEETVKRLVSWSINSRLFGHLSEQDIRHLIYRTWPLHPLTVFALVHLSSRVAQNERTMFTFLTSDEPNALLELVRRKLLENNDFSFIRAADLWDYFEAAVRADVGGVGTHRHWSGVINALDKVADEDEVAKEVVKALGVITICADISPVRPTTDLLEWAVGAESTEQRQAVAHALDNLRRRKVMINRQIDGYWTFISGSDIDFESRLRTTIERSNPSLLQLRRLLEQTIEAPYVLARRYNQQRAMTRYFTGIYRWAHELHEAPWDLLIEQTETDGLIVYVLATNEPDLRTAYDAVQANDRVVYVMPSHEHPLVSLADVLRELFALQEVSSDASLHQQDDRDRIQREIAWLMEDVVGRLEKMIKCLIDPRQEASIWITTDDTMAYGYRVASPGQASKIISDICDRVFWAAPVLNSEGLNRHRPTPQQNRAAQQVIDALFAHNPDETFGMQGRGPEVLALNALLKVPGILRQDAEGIWSVARPDSNIHLARVWDTIEDYLSSCVEHRQTLETLVNTLTAPPFGLRRGVLPVLTAAVVRSRLMVTSMWHHRMPISVIDGQVLIQAIERPSEYSIEIGQWSPVLNRLWQVLMSRFDEYISEIDRHKQPLSQLRSGMTRWLQGLPAFCRFTRQISDQAIKFRDVVRKVQTEPAKAIFESLPAVLSLGEAAAVEQIALTVDRLMQEISGAYYNLQRRLDVFAARQFAYTGVTQDGLISLKSWLSGIQAQSKANIHEFRFSTTLTQNVIDLLLSVDQNDGQFWNQMSEAVLGISLRDWNDTSEERFQTELLKARDEVERDVRQLMEEDKAVFFTIQLPEAQPREFRFRSSELSQHGQRLLQNFKSTMEIAGRPLPIDERRKIALAFLVHVMGEELDR